MSKYQVKNDGGTGGEMADNTAISRHRFSTTAQSRLKSDNLGKINSEVTPATSEFKVDIQSKQINQSPEHPQEEVVSETQIKKPSKAWIFYASAATICFTACNTTISEITEKSGPLCILYFSMGSLLSGLLYNLFHMT